MPKAPKDGFSDASELDEVGGPLASQSTLAEPPIEELERDENEPDAQTFVDLYCTRIESLAPVLAARIREETAGCDDWTEAVTIISAVIAEDEEGGKDIVDLGLKETLALFGASLDETSSDEVDVCTPAAVSVQEVTEATRLSIYRRKLYDACDGIIIDEGKRGLLLTTNPMGEEAPEVLLYRIAVIWVGEVFYAQMDISAVEALPTKAAKKRERTRLEGVAREQAIALLAEGGVINPENEA